MPDESQPAAHPDQSLQTRLDANGTSLITRPNTSTLPPQEPKNFYIVNLPGADAAQPVPEYFGAHGFHRKVGKFGRRELRRRKPLASHRDVAGILDPHSWKPHRPERPARLGGAEEQRRSGHTVRPPRGSLQEHYVG